MQWHQLDHMQTICTLLQTNKHTNTPITFYRLDVLPDAQPTVSKHWRKTKFSIPDKIPLLQRVQTIKILGVIFTSSLSVKLQTERQLCMHCMSCASMGCVTTHCMISSAQSPLQNSCMHPTPGGDSPMPTTDRRSLLSFVTAFTLVSVLQI